MNKDERLFRYKLTSIYSTKNLIIGKNTNENFNKAIKEMTKNFNNIKMKYFNKNKISIIQVRNKKIKDTLFINADSINTFLSELNKMEISTGILKQYSLTILNGNKKLNKIEKSKFKKIITPKIMKSKKSKKNINLFQLINNEAISDYIKNKEKIFKISKTNKNTSKKHKNKNNNSKELILLGKKRKLSSRDFNNVEQNNSVSHYFKRDINQYQYNSSFLTTSASFLNYDTNFEEENIDINNQFHSNKNMQKCILSTLKDISRETLLFLRQKPDTTIEEITKYIFNMVNIKTVHGKTQTYNNIQRRVYDTINVLQGLNKIEKKEFLRIHYILSEKEKKELLLIQKQKELLIKLYLLYMSNINFFKNIEDIFYLKNELNLNYEELIINKEPYLSFNDILEYVKEKIMDESKNISMQCYNYLYNKKILEKYRYFLLDYKKLISKNIIEEKEEQKYNLDNNDDIDNENSFNKIQNEYGNNFYSISTKFYTNDSYINQQREEENDFMMKENEINDSENSNENNFYLKNDFYMNNNNEYNLEGNNHEFSNSLINYLLKIH